METATSQLRAFLEHVVLENCEEFFAAESRGSARTQQLRLINAISGLDRAVYQAFFAQASRARFEDFYAALVEREPAIEQLRALSHVLKKNKSAAALVDARLASFLCAGARGLLETVSEFWRAYALALEPSCDEDSLSLRWFAPITQLA